MTEYLEPAAYGEFSLGLTIATFINQTLYGPLGNGISRFFSPALEDNSLFSYFKTSVRFVLYTTILVISISILILLLLFLFDFFHWFWVFLGSLILSSLIGVNSILSGIQGAARQRVVVAIHQGLDVWRRFLLSTLLFVWIAPISTIAMVGYGFSSVFVIISQTFFSYAFLKKELVQIESTIKIGAIQYGNILGHL